MDYGLLAATLAPLIGVLVGGVLMLGFLELQDRRRYYRRQGWASPRARRRALRARRRA